MNRPPALLVLAALLAPPAWACSCGEIPTLQDAYEQAERVAIVRVTSARLESTEEIADVYSRGTWSKAPSVVETVRASARVTEQFKGPTTRRFTLVGVPPLDLCFDQLLIGEEYLIFSTRGTVVSFNACDLHPTASTIDQGILKQWRGKL